MDSYVLNLFDYWSFIMEIVFLLLVIAGLGFVGYKLFVANKHKTNSSRETPHTGGNYSDTDDSRNSFPPSGPPNAQ